ncbi:MAG: protein-L-isoaspartate(D-aspartate) O-methyltransferase [Acidobacteria bacterium]|nr:protein-L-isoaspartate(D-aspartate) O-methyltransferase [Acidobacteriota bacterium]
MVRDQIAARGIRDRRVLEAMASVPRHEFVLAPFRDSAYEDRPLPIGRGQTISQPYIVARMAEALELKGKERLLEVGSGSGYAAAVFGRLAAEVYGIELEPELNDRAVKVLASLGVRNVHLRAGDGFQGWPAQAPFDAIVLSCAAPELPAPLWEQLRMGGVAVMPEGEAGRVQRLVRIRKTIQGPRKEVLELVAFVPLRRP